MQKAFTKKVESQARRNQRTGKENAVLPHAPRTVDDWVPLVHGKLERIADALEGLLDTYRLSVSCESVALTMRFAR